MKQLLSAVAVAIAVQFFMDWYNKQRTLDSEVFARANSGIRYSR